MSQLEVTIVSGSMRQWRLLKDFTVRIRLGVKVQSVIVPKGFVTDFATVPRILQFVFPPMGKYGIAALIHDYLCVEKTVTRKQADQIFYDLMKKHHVKPWKAATMYAAARLYAIVTGVDRRR
jgi:hypothetical protein